MVSRFGTLIIDYIMSTKKIFSLIDVDHCIILYIIEGKLIFKIKLVIATHASWIPSKLDKIALCPFHPNYIALCPPSQIN